MTASPIFVSADLDLTPIAFVAAARFGNSKEARLEILDQDGTLVAWFENGITHVVKPSR